MILEKRLKKLFVTAVISSVIVSFTTSNIDKAYGLFATTSSLDSSQTLTATLTSGGTLETSINDSKTSGGGRLDTYRDGVSLLPAPEFDSEWVYLNKGETITLQHGIGGEVEDYIVDLTNHDVTRVGEEEQQEQRGFNNYSYSEVSKDHTSQGVYWYRLTKDSIKVHRFKNDNNAEGFRLRIWDTRAQILSEPDYETGWLSIEQGKKLRLQHFIGGEDQQYFVDIKQDDTGEQGINNFRQVRKYPGHFPYSQQGVTWVESDSEGITIFRQHEDNYAHKFRIRIWRAGLGNRDPDYDSEDVSIGKGKDIALYHGLGGSIGDYIVNISQGQSGYSQEYYINRNNVNMQLYYENSKSTWLDYLQHRSLNDESHLEFRPQGVYYRMLTESSITLHRFESDDVADTFRVRIWKVGKD